MNIQRRAFLLFMSLLPVGRHAAAQDSRLVERLAATGALDVLHDKLSGVP